MPADSTNNSRLVLVSRSADQSINDVGLSRALAATIGAIASAVAKDALGRERRPWAPAGALDENQVFELSLSEFDAEFQTEVDWSLQSVCGHLRSGSLLDPLDASAIGSGTWSYYAHRVLSDDGTDAIVVRRANPTRGLKGKKKLFGLARGTVVEEVTSQLLAFEERGDVVVVEDTVLVLEPASALAAFVDADAVKARSEAAATEFASSAGFPIAARAVEFLDAMGSKSARVTLRVERLARSGRLNVLTRERMNEFLESMEMEPSMFGHGDEVELQTAATATAFLDLLEGRFYREFVDNELRRADRFSNPRL